MTQQISVTVNLQKAMLPVEREEKGKMTLRREKAVLYALLIHASFAILFERELENRNIPA